MAGIHDPSALARVSISMDSERHPTNNSSELIIDNAMKFHVCVYITSKAQMPREKEPMKPQLSSLCVQL